MPLPRLLKQAVVIVAFCAEALASADAQTNTRWTDPGGHFSLGYESLGWSPISSARQSPGDLISIEHKQFQRSGHMRMCIATQRRMRAREELDQQRINSYVAAQTPADVALALGATPTQLIHVDVDGVTVNDITIEVPFQHLRVFYLLEGENVLQFLVTCSASDPVTPEVAANITALLQTLHITSP